MYFSAAISSENDQGSMTLASNAASDAVQGCCHPSMVECLTRRWTFPTRWPVLRLVPRAVEVLRHSPDQIMFMRKSQRYHFRQGSPPGRKLEQLIAR
jgi:hypothetical protein